jgi:hypothetical protein
MEEKKCKHCAGKGTYSQIVGLHGAEDFGGDGFDIAPSIQNFPCKSCNGTGNPLPEDNTTQVMSPRNIEPVQEHEDWEERFDRQWATCNCEGGWDSGQCNSPEDKWGQSCSKEEIKSFIKALLQEEKEKVLREVEKANGLWL